MRYSILLLLASAAWSQSSGPASAARPVSSLPATCSPANGSIVALTTGSKGLYSCTATNTWTYIGSGSGGGGVTYCAPASASGTTYTCTPSPALSAYAAGNVLAFVPDVAATGGATTINVSALGAKSITLADGSSNPTSGTFVAGSVYVLTYDGTRFRIAPQAQTYTCTFTIAAADVAAIGATTTGEISTGCSIPANANYVGEIIAIESTTFACSSGNTCTLKFCLEVSGGSGSTCGIMPQYSLKQATNTQTNSVGTNPQQTSYTLKVGAVSTAQNLSTVNAGAATIKVSYVTYQ
jgi:hypothetical protein